MSTKKRLGVLALALIIALSLGASAFATSGFNGTRSGDYITEETYTIACKSNGKTIQSSEHKALGGTQVTLTAPVVPGYTVINESVKTFTVEPTSTFEYTDFQILDNGWRRVTPCFRLTWCCDDLQQHVVVAKKGRSYVIWTRDPLSESEKMAVYESFRSNVHGMFGARYENCRFMSANGSTLNGVTINNNFILFDDHCTWSMFAVGTFIPGGLEITPKPGVFNIFAFDYEQNTSGGGEF